ncbi:hypothetical protein BN1086_04892 [Citrobacter koseri]|uniref:DUF4158 domain-containing protein n=1 Tax=Citrobacter koseri TaxID=545 RepID=A0A078LND5_CITKO|nr:hypothetical protein BN1086_04892 [Citrobacter koseri]
MEKESLLALPDDELTLTRMTYFSEQDLAIINVHRKPASRFGFAVLLCYLKSIGFAPDKKSSPPAKLLKIISARLKLSAERWQEYVSGHNTTRREHMQELYRYLELKAFNGALQKECIRHLLPLSTRTDRGILIAEELLKFLHQQRIIIPGIEVLERTCAEAMTLGDKAVYTTLNAHLDITHKSALDALLVTNEKQSKDNFEPLHLITEKFSTLRKYSFQFLSALQLRATSAALPLNDALETIRDMYRKQATKDSFIGTAGFHS